MRIVAAIVSVLVGASVAVSVAWAQGDPRAPYGPLAAATEAKAKAQSRAARKQAAKPKPARAAKPAKPEPKPEAKRTEPPAAKPKPEVAQPAKPKPEKPKPEKPKPEKPNTKAAVSEPAAKPQSKGGKAKPDVPATTGAAAAAARVDQSLRDSYSAIPLAERIALQSDLIWTGDYNGLINGEFSERLVEAVKEYQKRHKAKTTGVLNPQERAALRASAKPRQNEVGWRLVEDPSTGARIGLPSKLATEREAAPSGTRWSSAQGQLQIETFRIETGATLEAVFERQKKDPPQRRVSYNVLRQDSFALSGMQGLKKFYVRGFAQNGEVRGITILYDQAMDGTMDPIVVAMSSAFAPFANFTVAGAADAPPRRRVDYGTGLVVSASGHVIAARQVAEGCQVIVVPGLGNAELMAEQSDGELALLRVYGMHKLAPIGLLGAAASGGTATLVGIADPQSQGGGAAVSTANAKIGSGPGLLPLDTSPALGFSGAAALDGKGEFLGMTVLKPSVVAGTASAPQAAVVPAAAIRDFLEAHHVAPASGQAGVEHAKASVVRVICVRK